MVTRLLTTARKYNQRDAVFALRNGAIAASILAATTTIFSIAGIAFEIVRERLINRGIYVGPSIFLDVLIMLACALGMFRKSRVATVTVFVYFLGSRLGALNQHFSYLSFVIMVVVLFFFGKAIHGSFAFHRLQKTENPKYKAASKWTYIIAVPSVSFVAVVLVMALMFTTGIIRSPSVLAGNRMGDYDIAKLRDVGIVSKKDKIEYFYSSGLLSILESGHILTQDRVISYATDEVEGLHVYEIPLSEVTDVALESEGEDFDGSVLHNIYLISTNDPESSLKLILSAERSGDQKFVDAIHDSISKLAVKKLGSVSLGMSPAEVELAKGEASSVVPSDSTHGMGWIYGESENSDDGVLWVLFSGRSAPELTVDLICRQGGHKEPLGISRFETEEEIAENLGQPTHLNFNDTGLSMMISYKDRNIAYELTRGRVDRVCVSESGEVSYQDELFRAMKNRSGQE